jgi:hypothetical protein
VLRYLLRKRKMGLLSWHLLGDVMAMGNDCFFCSLHRFHHGKLYLQPRSLFGSY